MSAPLRVVAVAACPFPERRGTPLRIQRMSEALAGAGHTVHVVAYHLGASEPDAPYALHRIRRVPTVRHLAPGPTLQKLVLLDPLLALCVARIVRRVRPDVIHAHHAEGLLAALPASRMFGVPCLYDAHTLLGHELEHTRLGLPRTLVSRVGAGFDAMLPRVADATIAVSDAVAAGLIARGADASRVSVAGNGAEIDWLDAPARPDKGRNGPRVVAYAGNLARYQRLDLLVEAFQRMGSERGDVRLRIVTERDGNLARRLAAGCPLAARIDVVETGFAGLRAELAQADVLVSPRTDCPGVPQKILNYMAAGGAIVAFAGSAALIEPGRTGLVVANGDVEAFAKAALSLLDDPARARALGDAARAAVRTFTWRAAAERVETAYRRALGMRAGVAAP